MGIVQRLDTVGEEAAPDTICFDVTSMPLKGGEDLLPKRTPPCNLKGKCWTICSAQYEAYTLAFTSRS